MHEGNTIMAIDCDSPQLDMAAYISENGFDELSESKHRR